MTRTHETPSVGILALAIAAALGAASCARGSSTPDGATSNAAEPDVAAVDTTHAEIALESVVLETLDGVDASWRPDPDRIATVFLFVRTDCPISNRYAPEYARLFETHAPQGVEFRFVYVDPDQTADTIRAHRADYALPADAWIDRTHALVEWTGATITPEAAVVDGTGNLRYRGRIDDRYVDFGKARREASVRDLDEAIRALQRGDRRPLETTRAVGCFIVDLAP